MMVDIYKYSVISLVPDDLRGERLNIGIIIQNNDKVDVRMGATSKLNSSFGGKWNNYVDCLRDDILNLSSEMKSKSSVFDLLNLFYTNVHASSQGEFVASTEQEKEAIARELVKTFVMKKNEKKASRKKININDEIACVLDRYNILGANIEDIYNHKVVRDYIVSSKENLRADFAVKNGRFHVAATLDLRPDNVGLDKAALKAIVLDKAKCLDVSPSNTRRVAVYASSETRDCEYHINILKDYSDDAYNWLDVDERHAFTQSFELAAGVGRLVS